MIAQWLREDLLKTIVLFELPDMKGGFSSHGTGVLINYKQHFFIATCKHIVLKPDGSSFVGLQATLNKSDGTVSRKNIDAIQKQFNVTWAFHENPVVDLALTTIAIEQKTEDIKFVGEDLLEDFTNIPLGDDVFFLGYPLGLGVQNVPKLSPLVRTGIVALKNSDSTFLLDANIYPGSSGSPVFYKPTLAQQVGTTMNIGQARPTKFLGIVSNNINVVEEAISRKTGQVRATFMENAGLGTVQSVSLLKEILASKQVEEYISRSAKAEVKPAEK